MIATRFSLPLFPEQASTLAPRVDALLFFLLAVSTFFTLLIAGCIVVFAIRYRPVPATRWPSRSTARTGSRSRGRSSRFSSAW